MRWLAAHRRERKHTAPERHAAGVLRTLISDLSTEDYAYLLDKELLSQRLYIFDPINKSVRHPAKDELPWTVTFALGRYSAKHRFFEREPRLSSVSDAMQQVINRVFWRRHFLTAETSGSAEDIVEGVPSDAGLSKGLIPPCNSAEVPRELKVWASHLRHRVINACRRALSRHKNSQH